MCGRAETRHRGEQRLRVGMLRRRDDVFRRADLDNPPEVHHGDGVADVADGREVVRDEHHRDAELRAQLTHQVQDGALHGDVERGRDFVGDHHLGARGERAGDRDPLALPTGEATRKPPRELGIEMDELEVVVDFGLPRPAPGARRVARMPRRSPPRPSCAG